MISSQCAASGFSMNKLRLLLLIQFHFFRQFRILMIPSYLMIRICFPYLKKGDLCHSHYASHMKLYSFQGLIIALFVTRLKLIITFFVITLIITFPESRRQVLNLNASIIIERVSSFSPHRIKVTGFEPMALCTQNRCADQTALHLVSPPRSI